jgi:hypothetical protein
MKLFAWLNQTSYVHPLADERRDLADRLAELSISRREVVLDEVSETNPALYESWMLEPYPGPGDK